MIDEIHRSNRNTPAKQASTPVTISPEERKTSDHNSLERFAPAAIGIASSRLLLDTQNAIDP